jgi:hypothetical protein
VSPQRLLAVVRLDLGQHLRRPMLWILVLVLVVLSWGMSSGDMRISSGDTSVGGQQAWITSQFANAYVLSISVFTFYSFFIAILAGMAVIRDDELKVGEVLHATPLTPGEYVWGKLLAVVVVFSGVLAVHVLAMVFFNHVVPNSEAAEIRGLPARQLPGPGPRLRRSAILFVAGVCFAIGERSQRPLLVFVLPLAAVVFSLFFFWNWSPSWLDPRLNRMLMLVDPSGFRWLQETWLKVDRGVGFYNSGRIGFDLPFLASRLGFCLLGLAAVAWSNARMAATLRGAVRARPARKREENARAATEARLADAGPATLSALRMTMTPPGFLRGALEVARTDFHELARSPGLYLFAPIILTGEHPSSAPGPSRRRC